MQIIAKIQCHITRLDIVSQLPFSTSLVRVIRILLNQGNWQAEIALSPDHCAIGIVLASLITAAIPFMFSIACGLGYLALTSAYETHIIPFEEFRTGKANL